jgi:hypothetical protein
MEKLEGLNVPTIEVNERELAALEQSSSIVMDMAQRQASAIVDLATCKEAQVWCSERITFATNLRKKSWLANIRDTWHKQHKSVCEIIEKYAAPHEIAVRKVVDPAITIFLRGEEEKRQAAQRKLQEEAKKREEDARLAKAEELAKQGKTQQADSLLNKPLEVVAPRLDPVKLEGRSARKTWKVTPLQDDALIALIKGISGGAVPIQAIEVNYSWLNKQAQLMDGNLKYPGVECYQEESGSYRRIA